MLFLCFLVFLALNIIFTKPCRKAPWSSIKVELKISFDLPCLGMHSISGDMERGNICFFGIQERLTIENCKFGLKVF